MSLQTPILFLVFNRLETTRRVLDVIKVVRPQKLYIAADGPREYHVTDNEETVKVRNYILDAIDWPCEVKTLFRERNLGCKFAVSSAITWFFEHEEMGIILEDDCLPSQSFFWFCEELLEKYNDDYRIGAICGFNKIGQWGVSDYYFSQLGSVWGWATWKRAWKLYDINMTDFENFVSQNGFEKLLGKRNGLLRQADIFNVVKNNVDTWDFQWGFAMHLAGALFCMPSKNLVENIGFGEDATHTKKKIGLKIETHEISLPLRDNNYFFPDRDYDARLLERNVFFLNRILMIINKYHLKSKFKKGSF